MKSEVPSKGLEWTNLILGAGLACSTFLFTDSPAAAWNAGIVGTLMVCCSAMVSIATAPGRNGLISP